jgi:glycosyltransferase involved in cell wall biosynthesis
MGIPVICNSGVGDVREIVEAADAGVVIDAFEETDFQKAVEAIPSLRQKSPERIREAARRIYDLGQGVERYAESYKKVLHEA